VDGPALGFFQVLEYCLVVLVILASIVLTLRLQRKGTKSKRRDIGPPLTGRQIAGAIAIMAAWWVGLLSVDIYIDSTMKPWTFEEWAYENLHVLFLGILILVVILIGLRTLTKRSAFPPRTRASSSWIPSTGWMVVRATVIVTIPVGIALYLVKSILALVLVALGVLPVLIWWAMSILEAKKGG